MHHGYEDDFYEEEDDELEDLDNDEETNDEDEENDSDEPIVREDKIFNNRYNSGEGLKDPDEFSYSNQISVSQDYADLYLKDLYNYETALEAKICLNQIFDLIEKDIELSKILKHKDPSKIKLSKEQINSTFTALLEKCLQMTTEDQFFSPIYIIEVMSSCTNIEYKKLFDALDAENQGLLVVELNKKFPFLDGKMHKKRLH